MDIKQQFLKLVKQYKYVALVLAAGMILMLIPGKRSETTSQSVPSVSEEQTMEQKLEQILSQIQGVGKVRVLLTVERGEQIIYVFDENRGDTNVSREAVVITDSNRAQTGLVSQVLPPGYLGAVVVCQGGENPGVKLAVVEAVCDATGLTADKISVLKMK